MKRSSLRLKTLGSFAIVDPPTLAATNLGIKDRALLAFLATKSEIPVNREDVSRLLWGDVPDSKRKHSLSQALCAINKALPGWIDGTRKTLRLSLPKTSVDLHLVRSLLADGHLSAACELLDGRFLSDITLNEEAFADWKDTVNFEFYSEVELQSLHLLGNKGNLSPLERHKLTHRLASVIPFSDSLRELELRLSRELRDEALARPAVNPGIDQSAQLKFVGRTSELNKFGELWDRCRTDTGHFLFIEGSAGVGKTRLIDEFRNSTVGATSTIAVRCFQTERHIGLNGVVDLVENVISESTFTRLPPVFAAALADVVGRDISVPYTLPKISTHGSQRRLFEAVLRVLQAELEDPFVLIFDDIHWADQSTLAFLHLLARRIHTRKGLVIAAGRPSRRLRSFSTSDMITRVKLGELSPTEIEALKNDPQLDETCRSASTSQLVRLTAGNAFLLTEYLRAFSKSAGLSRRRRMLSSHSSRDFIRALLAGLPGSSISVISALAVIGRPTGSQRLRRLSRQTPDDFSICIEQLVARRIIARERTISFRHDLIREGVYRRIPRLRRQLFHRRAALLLKKNGESFGAVARHFYLAGEPKLAHEYAMLAVGAADARSAPTEAAQLVKLAIKTAPNRVVRATLHKDLAHRAFRLRQYRDASQHIEAALEERIGLKRDDKAALALLQLEMLVTLGRISTNDLAAHLSEFETTYAGLFTCDFRFGVLRLLIRSAAIEGDTVACANYATELVHHASNCDGVMSARALSLAARIRSYTTSYLEALPWAETAERLITSDVSAEIGAEVLTNVGCVYSEAGDYRRARQCYDSALSLIQASGAFHIWPRTATHKHMLLVEMGLFEEARALAADIFASWNEDEAQQHTSTLEGNVALMYIHLQDYARGLVHAANSLSNGQNIGLYSHRLSATAILGLAHLEEGRLSAANACARSLLEQIGPNPKRLGDYSFVEIFIARWHVRHGRLIDAIEGLRIALEDCATRDLGSYLRMKLEYARMLRRTDPKLALNLAQEVHEAAVAIGASPTVEQSERLLVRCRAG